MCEQPLLLYGNDVKNREKNQQAVCVVFSPLSWRACKVVLLPLLLVSYAKKLIRLTLGCRFRCEFCP